MAYALNDLVQVWGVAGYGSGSLDLMSGEAYHTDFDMLMGALGVRGEVMREGAKRPDLAVRSDVLWVRTSSAAVAGLVEVDSDISRLRAVLEGSRRIALEGGTLTPQLELGVRRNRDASGVDEGVGYGTRKPVSCR